MQNPAEHLKAETVEAFWLAVVASVFIAVAAGLVFAVRNMQKGLAQTHLATAHNDPNHLSRLGEISAILVLLRFQVRLLVLCMAMRAGFQLSENLLVPEEYTKRILALLPNNMLGICLFLATGAFIVTYGAVAPSVCKRLAQFFRGLG